MSATTADSHSRDPQSRDPQSQGVSTDNPGIPFTRLLQVELRKMMDTRAGRSLVIVTAALMIVTVAIMLLVAALNDEFEPSASIFAGVLQFVSLLILPVFAIMVTTSEWNQRTHLTTFTLEPERSRIIWAKFAAVLVFSVATLLLAVIMGALGNLATGLFDRDPIWDFAGDDLAWSIALQLALIVSAFALGLLLLNTAAAISVFYVSAIMLRFIVYPILFGFVSVFLSIAPWVDVFFGIGVAQSGENFDGDPVSGIAQFGPMVTSMILWIVVPGVIGYFRAQRSELK